MSQAMIKMIDRLDAKIEWLIEHKRFDEALKLRASRDRAMKKLYS